MHARGVHRLAWACVVACAGCSVYDPALLEGLSSSGSGNAAAGSGGAGGVAGTVAEPPEMTPTGGTTPPPSGGAGGAGGAGGTGGASATGGMGGAPAMGGTGGSDPGDAQCGGGLKCEGGACVDPATSAPPTCTMGGTQCDAYMGSACAYDTGTMQGACLKSCGAAAMTACPAPLACRDFFGNNVCTDATNVPPPCTVGGTECAAYGFACSTAAGITACWMTCSP